MSAKTLGVQVPTIKTDEPKADATAGITMTAKKVLGAYITEIGFRRGAEVVPREEAIEKGFSVEPADAQMVVLLLECCAGEAKKECVPK